MTRPISWHGKRASWDEIKKLLVCGHIGDFERDMVVAILRDDYGAAHTIVVSINGSPPHAIAIMRGLSFDPERDDEVRIRYMTILDYIDADLKICKIVRGWFTVSLNELKQRKDVILTITPRVTKS